MGVFTFGLASVRRSVVCYHRMSSQKRPPWTARPLGLRQAAIMACLWEEGPLSATDVHEALSQEQDLAYTTIHTELSRLLEKGLVKKRGRNLDTKYAAAMSRDQFLQETVRQTLSDLIGAHGAAAVHGFVEVVSQDSEALAELRRAMERRQR